MARQISDNLLRFPVRGINVVMPREQQPEGTCVNCVNVRVFDSLEGRGRGGIRPGLVKYCSEQIDGVNRIQCLDSVTVIKQAAPATAGLGVRQVRPVVVCNGTVAAFNTTAVNTATVTGNTALSATAPFILSTGLFGRVYFTDGISYRTWVAANNTTIDWAPTAGSLPGTDGNTVPRLIESWRGRIVMSGLRTDPHNWFMSALGDPLDWDYAPDPSTEIQAVTGGTGVVGKIGEPITSLIPLNDDILLFGCDHSIWIMSGDPAAGGRLDLLSDTIGTAYGRPWCKDAASNVYFFSSRGAVYKIDAGLSRPQPLSTESIHPELKDTNLNTTFVRMAWNEDQQGFHLFLTPFKT